MSGKHDKAGDDEPAAKLLLTGPIVIRCLGRGVKDALVPGRPSRHRAFLAAGTTEDSSGLGDDVAPTALARMLSSGPAVDETGPHSKLTDAAVQGATFPPGDAVAQTEVDDGTGDEHVDDRRADDAPSADAELSPDDDSQDDDQHDGTAKAEDEAVHVVDEDSGADAGRPERAVEARSDSTELPVDAQAIGDGEPAATADESAIDVGAPGDGAAQAPPVEAATIAGAARPALDVVDDFAIESLDDAVSDDVFREERLPDVLDAAAVDADAPRDEIPTADEVVSEASAPNDVTDESDGPEVTRGSEDADSDGDGDPGPDPQAADPADAAAEGDGDGDPDRVASADDGAAPVPVAEAADGADELVGEPPAEAAIAADHGRFDDAAAEDAPLDDAAVEDVPLSELPFGDVPVDGGLVDDEPEGDVPVEDVPVEDVPVGDVPVDEQPDPDVPVENKADDTTTAGLPRSGTDEQAADEQAADAEDSGDVSTVEDIAVAEHRVDLIAALESDDEIDAVEARDEEESGPDAVDGQGPQPSGGVPDEAPIEVVGVDFFETAVDAEPETVVEGPDPVDDQPVDHDHDHDHTDEAPGDAEVVPTTIDEGDTGATRDDSPADPVSEVAAASLTTPAAAATPRAPRPAASMPRRSGPPSRSIRAVRERFGRESIGIAVLVVLALVCGGLITAVILKTQRDAAIAAQEAANYTPPPLATPEPTATSAVIVPGPVIAVIGDSTASVAAPGVTNAQKWSGLLESALSGNVSTDASNGMGYAAKGASGETFVQAAAKVPSNAAAVVFFGGAADANIPTPSLAKPATDAYAAAKKQAPGAKLVVVGPVITQGVSDAELVAIRDSLRSAAGIANATWIDPIDLKWLSAAQRSALSPNVLTAAEEKTIASKMEAAITKAIG